METQSTTTQKQRSPFAYSKIVFTEYAYAKQGQHFMTVNTRVDGKKVFLGKVFKTYDSDAKKYIYTATDRQGNPLFEPTEKIYELKNQFIENEKTLVPAIEQSQVEKEGIEAGTAREGEIKNVRSSKKDKGQQIER